MHVCLEAYLAVPHLKLLNVVLQIRVDKGEKLFVVTECRIGLCKAEEEKDRDVRIDIGPDTLFEAHGEEVSYDEAVEFI